MVNYDSEIGNQPSHSRTWEWRKVVVDTERREPDVGNRKDDSGLGVLADRLYQSKLEETRKRDPPFPGTWLSSRDNEQYRVKNKNQKLMVGQGNEQRFEREGQPLGPPGIKAPLTQVGVSTEIGNGNPIGVYRGKIVSGATGRPIVGNFRHWRHRGRPEIPRDQPVPVPPKWTGD